MGETPDIHQQTIEQSRSALHKLMNERVTNFDRGAVVHWAERGAYVVVADYKALEGEKAELVKNYEQERADHEETVKMMRELIAERDNEIACLLALAKAEAG